MRKWKKRLTLLFPLPSIILMILMGWVIFFSRITIETGSGERVATFTERIPLILICFIVFVLPLDFILYLSQKLFDLFKNKPLYPKLKGQYKTAPGNAGRFRDYNTTESENAVDTKEAVFVSENDSQEQSDEPKGFSATLSQNDIADETKEEPTKKILTVDSYFEKAGFLFIRKNCASIGMIEREFRIDFNRANKIVAQLTSVKVLAPPEGVKPQKVLMDLDEFEKFLSEVELSYDNINSVLTYNTKVKDISSIKDNDDEIDFDSMDGKQFEIFCAKLLECNGFINVKTTQESGDHGVDILAEKDDISYAIQCKCYSGNVGNPAIQQANTGKLFYQKDIAVVLTNSDFTRQAKEEAAVVGVKLWNGEKLNKLMNVKTNHINRH